MRKFLTQIFSVALAVAVLATPAAAQMAKKAVSPKAKAGLTAASKAQTAPHKVFGKGDKGFHPLTPRSVASNSPLKSAKTGKSKRVNKAIAKEGATLPVIYGSVIYRNGWGEGAPVGLYQLPQTAGEVGSLIVEGPDASAGGVYVDDTYYCTNYISFWGMLFIYVEAWDVEGQEKIGQWSPSDLDVIGAGGYALDPTSGIVYGATYNSAGNGLQLSKIEFGDEVTSTKVADLEGNWNSIAFDSTGQLYGISYQGHSEGDDYYVDSSALNKIDKTTGAVTVIGDTGLAPQYISSSTIDQKTNRMYWNVCDASETSAMYEVNLSTGATTLLFEIESGDEITGMYVPAPAAEETAPAACENVEVVFDEGALNGVVNLTAPANYFNGTAGSGALTVKVLANGEEIASQTATWGEETSVAVSVPTAAKYTFTVYAENATGQGPKTKVKNLWVGADTPEATKASLVYENGNMEVTWNAVTSSINGGYVDYDNLTYKVVRHDGTVAAEGLTVTSFSEAVAEPTAITTYYYTVYAVAGDLVSAGAETNTITLGAIVPPYTSDYATAGLDGWTVINANEDTKTWTVYNDEVRCAWNSSMEMDDWLITPPMKLEAGKAYNLTFSSHGYSTNYPERLEVKMGKQPTVEGMTTTVLEPTDIVCGAAQAEEFNLMLVPDADGTYYVGFHGISDADQFYLYLSNITIEAGISALAPGLATDVVVTTDASGALKANVSFKAPSTTMNGQALSSLTKVEVLRGDEVVKTFDAPSVGASLSFDDTLTEGGNVQYSIVGYNSEGKGLTATASAFIGFDLPAAITTVTLTRTQNWGEVVLTWDAVTADVNGLPYGSGDVKYKVTQIDDEEVTIAEDIDATSYTFQAVAAGEQDFVTLAVYPVTSVGTGAGATTDFLPVGTPYAGLADSFANGQLSYIWGLQRIGTNATVVLLTDESGVPSQDGDNGSIAVKAQYLDTGAGLFSGLVSLEGIENPGLTFYTFDIAHISTDAEPNPDINEISVSIRTINDNEYTEVMAPTTVQTICEGSADGWGKVTINLNDYEGQVIQFMITGMCRGYAYIPFDNIKVGSILANDLKAGKISAPAKVKVGEDYKVDVTVVNDGTQVASGYSVELYCDEDLVETKEGATLESGANTVVSFDFTMSAVAQEAVTYYAKVVYAADENLENNVTSTVTVAPIVSTLPGVTDLTGSCVGNTIKLTWNEPNLESGAPGDPVTEDFEDAEAFSAEYGDWTFIDGDQSEVGGFQGTDVPGITPGTTKGSFWIWDQSQLGNQTFAAHSGTKYLFALFRYDDGTTDDYAISPSLCGEAQTISFYAKSYSTSYPEKLRVLYSTSDSTDPEDYVEVMAPVTVPGEWTLYEVELPAGAVHFAINSCATSSFMLMVDDVTYTPGNAVANLELKGYNVYRDGVKINDAPVEETEYVDANVVNGEQYTYIVTAVYAERGESALSNECVITFEADGVNTIGDGAVKVTVDGQNIVVLNAEGRNVTVASANGAVVYSGLGEAKTVVAVGSGVYVVKADKTVKKVVVK